MNKLEQAILDIIEKRYKHKYVGGIKVTKLGSKTESKENENHSGF